TFVNLLPVLVVQSCELHEFFESNARNQELSRRATRTKYSCSGRFLTFVPCETNHKVPLPRNDVVVHLFAVPRPEFDLSFHVVFSVYSDSIPRALLRADFNCVSTS